MEIGAAFRQPVRFMNQEFIRVGSYKKSLKEFPEKERALWRVFDATPFERALAVENASVEEVLSFLDYPSYFDLLEIPLPDGHAVILEALARDELICPCETGGWNITNLGAVLFAKSSIHFPDSSGKLEPLRERFGVEEKNMAAVSRYIGEAVDEGVIKPYDEKAAKKFMKYVPFWA